MARMRSAVVVAKQRAAEQAGDGNKEEVNGATKVADHNSSGTVKKPAAAVKFETEGAVFEDGKVYLKGNPLQTTKEIICPDCQLPRLLYPTSGVGSRPPPDPYKEYCQKHPPISKPGCDVHGNLFATDKANPRKKKQQQQQQQTADAPASSPPSTPSTPATSFKQVAPERVSFPTVKCPICPRYFVVTRVAQHLDRCLWGGRGANRGRAAPSETAPSASKPSVSKRSRPSGDDEIGTTKKKKPNPPKKLTGKKPAPPSKLKNGTTPDMAALEATGSENKKKGSK